jgi:hypothetical protein
MLRLWGKVLYKLLVELQEVALEETILVLNNVLNFLMHKCLVSTPLHKA